METRIRGICDKVLSALWLTDSYRSERDGRAVRFYEPECRNLYYSLDHAVIVVAIDRDQLAPDRSAKFFGGAKSRAIFTHRVGPEVEAIEVDSVIYFRVPMKVQERLAA
jgi:hypothetical protein